MKKLVSLFLILSMSIVWSFPAFASNSTSILSEKTIVSRISDIMSRGEKLTIALSDGVITQYSVNNGDIVHVTSFDDGKTRYEYYCCDTQKIYSFYDESLNRNVNTTDMMKQSLEIEIFDVAEYKEKNTERYELGDEEEKEIREIMNQESTIELCQEQIEEAGYENIMVNESNGVRIASVSPNFYTKAKKTVNPTMQDLNDYQEVISWDIEGSASIYNNILKKDIQSRIYLFADNFVEKTMETTNVNAGLTLLSAAVLCTTSSGIFPTILGWASVGYSANGVLESFIFIDEQVYTYIAEKSGWTYDYISPNAKGRHNGYAICYYNQTLGKIAMGFDGLKERTNFHWAQTNPGIGDVYDLDNDYILKKAYDIYTSAVTSYGIYDAGYDGRVT